MNSLQARPLCVKSRISSIDVHFWDAGGGGLNQDLYVGRPSGVAAVVNSGHCGVEIQSSAEASSFLAPHGQAANANLLAINLTFSTQIGAKL